MFEIAAGTGILTTLASFGGDNGAASDASLVVDAAGNLYGTTTAGGVFGDGSVFEIAAGSNTITTLVSFDGGNGVEPDAGLTADAAGNLYGTTSEGGAFGDGTVFEIAAGTHALTTLASFNDANGAIPTASLIIDGDGNLYGTAEEGDAHDDGTLFEIVAAPTPSPRWRRSISATARRPIAADRGRSRKSVRHGEHGRRR
ncbi:MAG: choice-of-anchor tandem repeat GloVer-containing protein [Acetobacteraceae bacterium]